MWSSGIALSKSATPSSLQTSHISYRAAFQEHHVQPALDCSGTRATPITHLAAVQGHHMQPAALLRPPVHEQVLVGAATQQQPEVEVERHLGDDCRVGDVGDQVGRAKGADWRGWGLGGWGEEGSKARSAAARD